ncbi:Woronin body protein HexA [Rasamsonia emersonii CBS 393.64]|uniref:Woronin body protein HexA n=1 Tax=Rasamsonia emersonii (strain ATCC 16479 / CBS 393.64 / IMI 116815) TaxID=1408163 RepID=A0A0F4Z0L3_RASE3|nr:Woronin body protein HexA [Rasamsonia emersonii CBS 393.64]KKA23408.1 Woronin body protein HexA [Rasamsonia emersonii CBS 393.64]
MPGAAWSCLHLPFWASTNTPASASTQPSPPPSAAHKHSLAPPLLLSSLFLLSSLDAFFWHPSIPFLLSVLCSVSDLAASAQISLFAPHSTLLSSLFQKERQTSPQHSRKDAQRTVTLDFDARVPIPFSVFPSSYRSDAVSETTQTRVEGEVNFDRTSRVGREDTAGRLSDPRGYGREEVDLRIRTDDRRPARRYEESVSYESRERDRYPEIELSRERYREPIGRYEERRYAEHPLEEHPPVQERPLETQIDITEREYRRRIDPTYEVDVTYDRRYQPDSETYRADSYDLREVSPSVNESRYSRPAEISVEKETVRDVSPSVAENRLASPTEVTVSKETVREEAPSQKMGYYDDEGNYHSFRRGVERAADRLLHPFSHHDHKEEVVVSESGPTRYRDGVREDVRIVEPRGGKSSAETVPIPVHFIRVGDLLILQGRPCQVIRISVSPQTGQHRFLGVDLFTRQLHEESSFVSNPSPSVVVQTMLGPVYKTYRVLDVRDDGRIVAMTETGDVKQGLPVVSQGHLFQRIREAYQDGRGSVRALVINDGGRELVVDYKVVHGARL